MNMPSTVRIYCTYMIFIFWSVIIYSVDTCSYFVDLCQAEMNPSVKSGMYGV